MGELELLNGVRGGRFEPAVFGATSRGGAGRACRVRIGYNHRIPHAGRVFDVQSEDSGSTRKHIFTHVFHDGVIVASKRVEYGEGTDVQVVSALMKESHKSMVRALVTGGLDQAIARNVGPLLAIHGSPVGEVVIDEAAPVANDEPSPKARAANDSLDLAPVQRRLAELADEVSGTLAVVMVELERGCRLASVGTALDVDALAAGYREIVRAQLDMVESLGEGGDLDDLLITLDGQHHLVRLVDEGRFLVLVIDRERGNLALARRELAKADLLSRGS